MKAINITAYTNDDAQIEAIMAVIKAFKIKYKISTKNSESQYNAEFVEKIKESKRQIAKGKFTEIGQKDIKSFIDSL